jgi:hypothetical protein
MPSWMARVKGPNGLIKRERSASCGYRIIALIKVENVSQERISVINLNCYRINTPKPDLSFFIKTFTLGMLCVSLAHYDTSCHRNPW